MILCPKCGTTQNDDMKYCSVCGFDLQTAKANPYANMASSSGNFNFFNRVVNILTKPMEEWKVIENEKADKAKILFNYVFILILIPIIFTFLGMFIFSRTFFFGGLGNILIYNTLPMILTGLIVNFVVVIILAAIVDALAPNFRGQKNSGKALQLVAFSLTPYWVAGVLHIFPFIGFLNYFAGIYSIILFYYGLKHTMKPSTDNETVYTIIYAILCVALYVVLGLALGLIFGAIFYVRTQTLFY